jgi:glutaredoxin-related protein
MTCKNPPCKKKKSLNEFGLCPSCVEICERFRKNDDNSEPVDKNNEKDANFEEFITIHDKLKKGETVDYNTMMTALFGGIYSLATKIENVKKDLEHELTTTNRKIEETNDRLDDALVKIKELELKVEQKEEYNMQSSIVFQNLPVSESKSDKELVEEILADVNADGLNVFDAITTVKRVGQSETKAGTILVEIVTDEAKVKIMKAKKTLLKHPNMMKRKIKIRNMKSKEQMTYENNLHQLLSLVPDGNQFGLNGIGKLIKRTRTEV